MSERNIFNELMEGFDDLAAEREGKKTLRKFAVERKPPPEVTGETIRRVREKLNVSQPVFALQLRTEPRTIANWEQGVSKPNAQAAILIALVDRNPALIDEIAEL